MAWSDLSPLVATSVTRDVRSGRSEAWMNTALRTRSEALRDVLASDVDPGTSATALRDELVRGKALVVRPEAVASAAVLATVWAASAEGLTGMVAGYRLLRQVVDGHGAARLLPIQRQVYAQVAYLLGEDATVGRALQEFHDLPRAVAESLRTDLLNPLRAPETDMERWHAGLSEPFTRAGLAPISTTTGQATPFDGLRATSPAQTDGPLVSVIMPCYQPDAGLLTSVRSILAQSHAHLEILLVDDASGPDYAELFDRCVALDSRVRLIRLDRNGGTYLARNAALADARGELVTVQDADDWSHPSRLADQSRLLAERPHASGSRSDAIRATDDLVHQWVGYSPRRRNASSLMFRRSALERTGPFDAVRKGADSEFHERLTRLVGPVADTRTPLAVTRLRSGTLSRGDFGYRWMTPDRQLYRAAYRSWHRSMHRDSTPLPPVVGDVTRRPFPAPATFLRGLGAEPRADVDVLLVLDGSDAAAGETVLATAGARPDLAVGILHLEDPTRGRTHQSDPVDALLRAARAGTVTMVSATDEVRATVTVVLTSGVLELPVDPPPRVQTHELVVAAQPPSLFSGISDLSTAHAGALTTFGRVPRWCAVDVSDREEWEQDGWTLPVLEQVLPQSDDRSSSRP